MKSFGVAHMNNDADRYFEASAWSERHIEQGYVVEYKEELQ